MRWVCAREAAIRCAEHCPEPAESLRLTCWLANLANDEIQLRQLSDIVRREVIAYRDCLTARMAHDSMRDHGGASTAGQTVGPHNSVEQVSVRKKAGFIGRIQLGVTTRRNAYEPQDYILSQHGLSCKNGHNIRVHDWDEERYICHACKTMFTATKGTPFAGLKTEAATASAPPCCCLKGRGAWWRRFPQRGTDQVRSGLAACYDRPRPDRTWGRRCGYSPRAARRHPSA